MFPPPPEQINTFSGYSGSMQQILTVYSPVRRGQKLTLFQHLPSKYILNTSYYRLRNTDCLKVVNASSSVYMTLSSNFFFEGKILLVEF